MVIGVYEIYRLARIAVRGTPSESLRHALQLVRLERRMHLYVERGTQDLLVRHEALIRFLDAYHGIAHFIAVGVTLAILWRLDRCRYTFWRNTFGWLLLIGLIGFALYPVTPPRLMPSAYGFVDTARQIGGLGPLGAEEEREAEATSSPVCRLSTRRGRCGSCCALWPLAGRWWMKALLVAHLVVMHVTIIATGSTGSSMHRRDGRTRPRGAHRGGAPALAWRCDA